VTGRGELQRSLQDCFVGLLLRMSSRPGPEFSGAPFRSQESNIVAAVPPGSSPPVKIGSYVLGKTLGVGSFGKVKEGYHELCGQKVAVKILNRSKVHVMDMTPKVRREIMILRLLNHKHLIKLYEVIECPSDIFVVTEYISGGELFDFIVERGRLPENEARRFFQQLIGGVEYCHRHMIIHRDLKPENLLLDENLNIKIADLGLANIARDGEFLRTSCGSPNYAAPEVISGKPYAGPEVDIWSCGVILYALLCGSLPFDDESIAALFRRIKSGQYQMPSYLSPGARDLISRMLIVDPLARITIEQIRKHPWFVENLPRYLSLPPPTGCARSRSINVEVLRECIRRTGFPEEKIVWSLKHGKRNAYTVAYELIHDAMNRMDDSMLQPVDIRSLFSFPGIGTGSREKNVPESIDTGAHGDAGSRAAVLPSSATSAASASPLQYLDELDEDDIMPCFVFGSASRRIQLGIVNSYLSASEIMMELYRALSVLQWRWKSPSVYHIRVIAASIESALPGAKQVRLVIQLYRTASRFVVDIALHDGDLFSFILACHMIVCELRI